MIEAAVTQHDFLLMTGAMRREGPETYALLPQVQIPTLLLAARDGFAPRVAEASAKRAAAAIPGAKLAIFEDPLGGLTASEGSVPGVVAVEQFVRALEGKGVSADPTALSAREWEVLRLLAAGRSNAQIADQLTISPFTVNRHVSNIFNKIGAANRVEATMYARDHGLA